MSEDIQTNVETTEVAPTETTQSTTTSNDFESRAREMGWVPKEEYSGDPTKWKSAEVFVALDEPIRRIEQQSQELKQVRRALDALKTHHSRVQENEYKRAVNDLRDKRKKALEDGNIDEFDKYDEALETAKEEYASIKEAPAEPETVINPEFRSWLNKNSWYENYSHMRQFADDLGVKLHQQGLERNDVLRKVEDAVRKEFPNKFTNPNKEKAPDVEAGNAKNSGKRSESVQLTDEERSIMNTFIRSGVMTKEEYLSELKKVKQ